MTRFRVPGNIRIWSPLIAVMLILTIAMPRFAKFNYDYKKGAPWNYETLISQFDFPILKTQEQINEEKDQVGSRVIPYFRYSDETVDTRIKAVDLLELGSYGGLKSSILSSVKSLYDKGIISDKDARLDKDDDASSGVIFIQRDKRAVKQPISEVYRVSEAKVKLLASLGSVAGHGINLDSLLKKSGAYELIVPNLIYDEQTTNLVHAESADYISPTSGFVSAGQLIVSKGEIVTGDVAQMLDSYKIEYENNMGYAGPKPLFWIGNAIISFLLVLLLFLTIHFVAPDLFSDTKRYLYLLTVFLLASLLALIIGRINQNLLYLIPFSLSALYLLAFFKYKIIIPVYIISLLPLLLFSNSGVVLFSIFLVAGMVTIIAFKFYNRGWKQFLTSAIVFAAMTLTYLGFRFVDCANGNFYQTVLYLFISSLLSVAGYPLIYLFERAFSLVSSSRLMELCDPNNELLHNLEHNAPGSFQHSLQVMNMSDAAARSIGADALLARTGALYHDIGKIAHPQCFIENESLAPEAVRQHFHDGLTPVESARIIIRHVDDGIDIANKYQLPEVIKDFILTHHGTTLTRYFYNKYLNEGGDPANADEFRYHGKKPSTKEQVLVMICDSVEAASRSLKDYTPESFDSFVEKIVASKMDEGQFDDADITLKELNTVKKELKSYLVGVHHERIVYPKVQVGNQH